MAYTPPTNSEIDFGLESTNTPTNDTVDFSLAEGLTVLSVDPITTDSQTSVTTQTESPTSTTTTATTDETVGVSTQQTTVSTDGGGTTTSSSETVIPPRSTTFETTPTTTPISSVYTKRGGLQPTVGLQTTVENKFDGLSPSVGVIDSETVVDSTSRIGAVANGFVGEINSTKTIPSTFEITQITPNFKYLSDPKYALQLVYDDRITDVRYKNRDMEIKYE